MFLGCLRGQKNRRQTVRIGGPGVKAFLPPGGPSEPLRVRDIGSNGAFIETGSEWFHDTVVHLVLLPDATCHSSDQAYFGLWARVVRSDATGMGVEFISMNRKEKRQLRRFLESVSAKRGQNSQSLAAGL